MSVEGNAILPVSGGDAQEQPGILRKSLTLGAVGGQRFLFVDGLRGVAAVAVMLFHFGGFFAMSGMLPRASVVAHGMVAVTRFGYLGVEVFFVLSGFVITHSLRNIDYTLNTVGRFIVRRSIRIDPPYWATIVVTVLIAVIGSLTGHGEQMHSLSFGRTAAHLFYLQDLLGYEPLSPVFWTLCLEIQFYLVFVLCGYVSTLVFKREGVAAAGRAHVILTLVLFGVSVGVACARVHFRGWFIEQWFMFALGVCVYWHVGGRLGAGVIGGVFAAVTGLTIFRHDVAAGTALLAASSLLVAARTHRMGSWLSQRWIQYCGRMSYSLYLVHSLVAGVLYFRLLRFVGHNEPRMWLLIFVSIAVSFTAAGILYYVVERPTMALAHRISGGRRLTPKI